MCSSFLDIGTNQRMLIGARERGGYRRRRDFFFWPGIFMFYLFLYYSLPRSRVGPNTTPNSFRAHRWSTFNRARCDRIHLYPRRQSIVCVRLYRLLSRVFMHTRAGVSPADTTAPLPTAGNIDDISAPPRPLPQVYICLSSIRVAAFYDDSDIRITVFPEIGEQ